MSGDTINLTVTEAVETINLTLEEEASITVNFLEVATVDPRVAQTLLSAQAAQAAAETAQSAAEAAALAAASSVGEFQDNLFAIINNADNTKRIEFDASSIATGTARTISVPNANVDLGLISTAIQSSEKGVAYGVATLDSNQLIPTQFLPGYVDDVLEYTNLAAFPVTGESGKIYVSLATLRTYRWGGSTYSEVSPSAVTSVNGQSAAVTLTTTEISEGSSQYFTSTRAKTAAVVNSTAGSETDQAPSVSSIKAHVATHTGATSAHGASGAIVGTTDTQTLTNKTIVAANNTITTSASGVLTATELNAVIAQIATQLGASSTGVPSGSVLAFAGTTAPTGYLACDGSSVLRATYPALFTAIGTAHGTVDGTHFNLPDYRGRFLRGVDGGIARDPGRTTRTAMNTGGATGDNIGSVQLDDFKSHSHTVPYTALGSPGVGTIQYWNTNGGSSNSVAAAGGNETRPINASVNYIIKT